MRNPQVSSGGLFAGRFELDKAVGTGGMGTVYRARDRYSGEVVALKLLNIRSGPAESADGERFAREAQLLSELRHPGIVAHVAHGQAADGQRFLAMEWLEGEDLGQRLLRGPLALRDCLSLIDRVADALAAAHQHGVIHRDIKPTNLFLVRGDAAEAKILDFGIARRLARPQAMTQTGMIVGTPEYMAPEQARGARELTPAADLFSLGCVLYECLTGRPPFVAEHLAAVLVRILFEEPAPVDQGRLGLPPRLTALLGRLLIKDPGQRLAVAAELRRELAAIGELPEPVLAPTRLNLQAAAVSFAELEQDLFSVVLAAPAEESVSLAGPWPQSGLLAAADRQLLVQALAALGVAADFLANGALVVPVPSTGSAIDQAAQAARAALLIKERWPAAVVSMATGRGAMQGRTAVGEVVEMAARSLKQRNQPAGPEATAGVLLDRLSAKLLEGRFAQTPHPGGARLLGEEREGDASRPLLGRPTPCVGRDAELGTLELQLRGCIEESEARAMLLSAPPGVGKTRLRHEFLRRIEKRGDPLTLLLGRGDQMSAGTPYGILRSAVQHACGIIGSEPLSEQKDRLRQRIPRHLAPAEQERVVLFIGEVCNLHFPAEGQPMLQAARQDPKVMGEGLRHALLDWLAAECAAAPVLLVLDDLQWSDELTVSVLDEALERQQGAPLFVLALARPEVHQRFPKLWHRHKVQEVQLKGLSKRACERLIQQVLAKPISALAMARAVEQSAGNALFLEELIRSIAEESDGQADTVVAMLQARIGRLPAGGRRAVRAAAVFGQTFWLGGIAALAGLAQNPTDLTGWLSSLVDAELIQVNPQSRLADEKEYEFRHALVRDAAYSLLTDADREVGHQLAGEWLERAGMHDALALAEHYARGRAPERASHWYRRSAEQAMDGNDFAAASERFEKAIGYEPRPEVQGPMRASQAEALLWLNDMNRARELATLGLTGVVPGTATWFELVATLINGFGHQGDNDSSEQWLEQAIAMPGAPDAVAAKVMALCRGLNHLPWAGRHQASSRALTEIDALIGDGTKVSLLTRARVYQARAVHLIHTGGDPEGALRATEAAVRLYEELGNLRSVAFYLAHAGLFRGALGDYEGMAADLRRVAQLNERVGSQMIRLAAQRVRAKLLADQGQVDQARVVLDEALSLSAGNPRSFVIISTIYALLERQLGNLGQAELLARTATTHAHTPTTQAMAQGGLAHVLLALGRTHEALGCAQAARQALAAVEVIPTYGFEAMIRLAWAEALRASGDHRAGLQAIAEAREWLLGRAARIRTPALRESFLARVPENARILELAARGPGPR